MPDEIQKLDLSDATEKLNDVMRNCTHSMSMPNFDVDACKGLSPYEVRKRWPRFMGKCPQCGELVILYASTAHYTYGDW